MTIIIVFDQCAFRRELPEVLDKGAMYLKRFFGQHGGKEILREIGDCY